MKHQYAVQVVVFLSLSISIAQEKITLNFNKAPLKEVFKAIESQSEYRFSYNEAVTKDKALTVNITGEIQEILAFITSSLGIYFNAIDKQNIIVQKQKPSNKTHTICGIIEDDNGVLAEVAVRLESQYYGTISKQDGSFSLDHVQLGDTIVIQYLGYKTLEIAASVFIDKPCKSIVLEPDPTQLSEVVLKEYITTGFDRDNHDGSVTIKPNKLGILPGLIEPDVLQSLQLLPGISSPRESASDLHIRGGTPDQNLVLWDNIKIYHQGHFFGQISAFNPYITSSVKVYRSATSAQYGDRVSGVIDIKTSNEIAEQFYAGAGLNLTQADVFIGTPILQDTLSVVFSARRSFSDILNTITFENLSSKVFQNTKIEEGQANIDETFSELNNTFYFTDTNLKLNWKPTKRDAIFVSGLLVYNELDYSVQTEIRSEQDQLDLMNNGFSFEWNRQQSEKLSLKLKSYRSNYRSNFSFTEQFFDENVSDKLVKENTVGDFGISLQSTLKWNTDSTIFTGYDYVNNSVFYQIAFTEGVESEVDENEDKQLVSHSVFSEYEYRKEQFLIRAGIRANYFTSDQTINFEPRLHVEKNISDNWLLKASGEIKNQALSQLVLFDFNEIGVGNNIWILADNEEIPILNSRQITTGLLFQKNGWSVDIDGYYKKIKGLTSFSKGFTTNTLDDYSQGTNTVYGVDMLIKKRIGNFRTWLSYSLSKSEFSFPELATNVFPGSFDQRHVLTLANSLTVSNIQLSLGWSYATGRPYSQPTGISTETDPEGGLQNTLVFDAQNNSKQAAYHKLDFSATYDFFLNKRKKTKAKIGASLLNIYNRANEIDKRFKIDENTNNSSDPQIIEETRIGLGITPNILFRVEF
jgi:hypothetical protein